MTKMPPTTTAPDLASAWAGALSYEQFVAAAAPEHRGLWEAIGRLHTPNDLTLGYALPTGTRLLVIAADWCGDAVNTIPALANWARTKGTELRLIDRDTWPQVMDHYLTGTSRSIPVVILLDPEFRELGHWGPRPSELQAWVMVHKTTMEKGERYKEVRRWYAKDRGATTIREVIESVRGSRKA
jgi:thioredoxin family protein